MRNWSEYTWLANHLVATGFIKTIRELWWDVRPHQNFGTVEVRICDMPPTLGHVLGLTALIQCLVHNLSLEIDQGTYQYDCHPFMVRQNKWRACRYGMNANLVDPHTSLPMPARQVVHSLIDRLETQADELGCASYLQSVRNIAEQPTGSVTQLQVFHETNDLAEVVRRMLALTEAPAFKVDSPLISLSTPSRS